MLDKFLAALSLCCLIGFMMFVVYYIAEPDLTLITVVVLVMAAYDFYRLNTTDKPKAPSQTKAGS
jgi:hypothetical protein